MFRMSERMTVAVGGDLRMPVLGENIVASITKDEVHEAVEVLKAGKAQVSDGIALYCV